MKDYEKIAEKFDALTLEEQVKILNSYHKKLFKPQEVQAPAFYPISELDDFLDELDPEEREEVEKEIFILKDDEFFAYDTFEGLYTFSKAEVEDSIEDLREKLVQIFYEENF